MTKPVAPIDTLDAAEVALLLNAGKLLLPVIALGSSG